MGQSKSRHHVHFYDTTPQAKQSKIYFEYIGLSEKDVFKLYTLYTSMNIDDDCEAVDMDEILKTFKIEATLFIRKVLDVFGLNLDVVTFRAFVIGCWAYCTLSNAAMVHFIFDMYTPAGVGGVVSGDMNRMLLEMYGSRYDQSTHAPM